MKKYLILIVLSLTLALPTMVFAGSSSDASAGAVAIVESSSQYQQPQPIYPYMLQLIPGVIGDATRDMAIFDVVQVLTTEKVVKVVTFNGWCLDRVRLEDVEKEVINNLPNAMKKLGVDATERIRFRVKYKMSSRTIGSGGGGGGSVAGFGGGTNPLAYGSNASIMPAVAVNTADPQFVISYYLIK
jgi:hypothetical protein